MKISLAGLNPRLKSHISGSAYIFLSVFFERALFFILFVILARKLSPDEYGKIIFIFTSANILASFFEFGLPVYFQRESASASSEINNELSSALKFKLLSFPVYIITLMLYLVRYSHMNMTAVAIIGSTLYLFSLNVLLNSLLYGLKKYKSSFYGLLLSRLSILIFLLVYYFRDYGPEFVILGFLFSAIIHFIVLRILLKKNRLTLGRSIDWNSLKKIFSSSAVIYLGYIFVWIYDRLDVLILQHYLNYEAVATYAIAYSVYKLPQILSGIILVPLFSNLSKEYSELKTISKANLINVLAVLLISVLSFCFLIGLNSEWLIKTIYGWNYSAAGNYLQILLLAAPALILNNLTGVISNTIRKEKYALYGTAAGTVINLLICFAFIPVWGNMGAVAATIAAEYVVLGLQLALLVKHNSAKLVFV